MNFNGIDDATKYFAERIESLFKDKINTEILIFSNSTADGILSSSIIFDSVLKNNIKPKIRVINENNITDTISNLPFEKDRFCFFMDFYNLNMHIEKLLKILQKNCIIIDHCNNSNSNNLSEQKINKYSDLFLNPWMYGINGSNEISSGGLAFLIAEKLDDRKKNLANLAVISALADNQDVGERNSLVGLNSKISNISTELGLLEINVDLMIKNKNTLAIPEAIAYNFSPYIEGLTWNKDNCHKILRNAGVELKGKKRWRILSELSEEEKSSIFDTITKYLIISSKNEIEDVKNNLVGYNYILIQEDENSILYDAREFGHMINSCLRFHRYGLGIAICLGERDKMLYESEIILDSYKNELVNIILDLTKEKWRIIDNKTLIIINGEGVISEEIVEFFCSYIIKSVTYNKKIIFVRTLTKDGDFKIVCKKSKEMVLDFDMTILVKNAIENIGEIRNSYENSIIVIVPYYNVDKFFSNINTSYEKNILQKKN